MGIVNVVYRAITCNGPECKNTLTFDVKDGKEVLEANPWLLGLRFVKTPDERELIYCSDLCELNGIRSGVHNRPEVKKIVEMPSGAGLEQIKQAAQRAAQQEQATAALKAGTGVTLQGG